jgi:hypothetical protein
LKNVSIIRLLNKGRAFLIGISSIGNSGNQIHGEIDVPFQTFQTSLAESLTRLKAQILADDQFECERAEKL